MNEDARNSLADIELLTAIVAIIQAAGAVVALDDDLWPSLFPHSLQFCLGTLSYFFERAMHLLDLHTTPA